MTAQKLAKVGDVIEHGQDIPANVRQLQDRDGSVWHRNPIGHFHLDPDDDPATCGDNCMTDGHILAAYGPLTVVEVDPEPQPAEPQPAEARCCDGMVRYGQHDRYCPARNALDADGFLRLKGTATGDNQLDPEPWVGGFAVDDSNIAPEPQDDLDRFLAEQMRDRLFAAAYEDAGVRPRLILKLTALRKARGLTVEQVAEDMQVKPKRVRQYEGGLTDPALSMHQRYARAVGARIVVEVVAE